MQMLKVFIFTYTHTTSRFFPVLTVCLFEKYCKAALCLRSEMRMKKRNIVHLLLRTGNRFFSELMDQAIIYLYPMHLVDGETLAERSGSNLGPLFVCP